MAQLFDHIGKMSIFFRFTNVSDSRCNCLPGSPTPGSRSEARWRPGRGIGKHTHLQIQEGRPQWKVFSHLHHHERGASLGEAAGPSLRLGVPQGRVRSRLGLCDPGQVTVAFSEPHFLPVICEVINILSLTTSTWRACPPGQFFVLKQVSAPKSPPLPKQRILLSSHPLPRSSVCLFPL